MRLKHFSGLNSYLLIQLGIYLSDIMKLEICIMDVQIPIYSNCAAVSYQYELQSVAISAMNNLAVLKKKEALTGTSKLYLI